MWAKLGPFWKGVVGSLTVVLVLAVITWVVVVTIWALHGQQTFNYVESQLRASQAQQQAVQPKGELSPPKSQ